MRVEGITINLLYRDLELVKCQLMCCFRTGTSQAPAKRSEATYRNIVGCNMLPALGHDVAMCCDMLGVVGSNLKMLKCFTQRLWMLHDVVVVWPGPCDNVVPGHAH